MDRRRRAAFPVWATVAIAIVLLIGVVAWRRTGLLNLPPVPVGASPASCGLDQLSRLKMIDDYLHGDRTDADLTSDAHARALSPGEIEAASLVRGGMRAIDHNAEEGLERMREGLRRDPANLALANAYRMTVFQLKRDFLNAARREGRLVPEFPSHLEGQPIVFFEELVQNRPSRETNLHLALAWVDHMLLFPALEIKAPSSVEAVDILTRIIDGGDACYVPALFARGMNHLHRPARLVWPESTKTSIDAAERDFALCIAIGRTFDVGSDRLRALLMIARGDAFIKMGKYDQGRSCWQIAQNLGSDEDIQSAVRRRYAWRNDEAIDRLEEELDRARSALDRPMTDLSFFWN